MQHFDTAKLKFYANVDVEISGGTKLFGILGYPVDHSLSPLFQMLFLHQYAIDAVYVPFCVPEGQVQQALDGLWAIGAKGFNVTVPHKETVLQYVDADADAMQIGAVNTVRRSEHGWQATNTDWRGFSAVLAGLGANMKGRDALLFGAGGTAHAIVHALAGAGLRCLYVCNRTSSRLSTFLKHASKRYPDLNCKAVEWSQDEVTAAAETSDLLINTTSIGLQGKQAQFPFSLSGGGVAVDAVYTPDGRTPFCLEAECVGRQATDGLPMLIAQGAASFAYWHQTEQPDLGLALHWMEEQLGRTHLPLSGWGARV